MAAQKKKNSKKKPQKTLTKKMAFKAVLFGVLSLLIFFTPNPQGFSSYESDKEEIDTAPELVELPPLSPIPIQTGFEVPPIVSARGLIVYDPRSNITLYQMNADTQLMPASTTKIMTALVALDTYDLSQVITITEEERTIGNTMKLNRGEQLTVNDLMAGLLISSGNDAALALALAYPNDGYSGFVAAMNQKARQLGLPNTRYRNVSGVESFGHYTSARDLAHLAAYALNNPIFKNFVGTPAKRVTSLDGNITHQLSTTNALLGKIPGLYGVKTGWTENAGECLVSAIERDGNNLIVVVLGSNDRFGDSQKLIEWAYGNFTWKDPLLESLIE